MVIGATSPKPEPRPSMKPLDPNLESQKIVTDPGPGSWVLEKTTLVQIEVCNTKLFNFRRV